MGARMCSRRFNHIVSCCCLLSGAWKMVQRAACSALRASVVSMGVGVGTSSNLRPRTSSTEAPCNTSIAALLKSAPQDPVDRGLCNMS
eukprot:14017834-Alexandrium_andersonii.AAC.1